MNHVSCNVPYFINNWFAPSLMLRINTFLFVVFERFQFKQIVQTAPHRMTQTNNLHIPILPPITSFIIFVPVSCFLALINVKMVPRIPPAFHFRPRVPSPANAILILDTLLIVVGNVETTPRVSPLESAFVFDFRLSLYMSSKT